MFAKARRDKKGKGSGADSIGSNGSEAHSFRSSLEDAIERAKAQTGADSAEPNTIKKLVSKGPGSRRRRKQQVMEEEKQDNEAIERGKTIAERGTLINDTRSDPEPSGDGSSLLTYESDTES
jgi:hypothetical protein